MEKMFEFLAITLLVAAIVFVLLREFMCWYFKINQTLDVLNRILRELQKTRVYETATGGDAEPKRQMNIEYKQKVICPLCGKMVQINTEEATAKRFTCAWCEREATLS